MTEPSPLRYKAIQRACTERHVGGLDPGYEDVAAGVDAALSVTRQHVERLRVAWSQNDDPEQGAYQYPDVQQFCDELLAALLGEPSHDQEQP